MLPRVYDTPPIAASTEQQNNLQSIAANLTQLSPFTTTAPPLGHSLLHPGLLPPGQLPLPLMPKLHLPNMFSSYQHLSCTILTSFLSNTPCRAATKAHETDLTA